MSYVSDLLFWIACILAGCSGLCILIVVVLGIGAAREREKRSRPDILA
jgi:hypothetical protein